MGAKITTSGTITFSTGFFAKILSLAWSGIERGAVDTSHLGTTTARTFIPTNLYDAGELEVELIFEAETTPPITGAAETVTVTVASDGAGGTSTWAASGFLTGFEFTGTLEEMMTATARIKFSGAITVTA